MKSVSRRISDRQMLHLIKMWLKAPTEEAASRGGGRGPRSKSGERGTPQGSPISPLLSNLYMRRFLLGWKVLGYEGRLQAQIVNYADDFVICCRGTAMEAMHAMRSMMSRLKLTVNESKTRHCRLPEESLEFLGYTIGRCWSAKRQRLYLGTRPSPSRVQRICRAISELTERRTTWLPATEQVRRLNQRLLGWANYFRLGRVSPAYRAVDGHARRRLRQWLRKKHKVRGPGKKRFPDEFLHNELGLIRLAPRTRDLPWAKA